MHSVRKKTQREQTREKKHPTRVRAHLVEKQGAVVLVAGVLVEVGQVQPYALCDARLPWQLVAPIQGPHPLSPPPPLLLLLLVPTAESQLVVILAPDVAR